jgi:hypothetical protein
MRWSVTARALTAIAALAVAAALVGLERDTERCQELANATYLAAATPRPELQGHVDALIDGCSTAKPLTDIAVGLRSRPFAAAQLARAATRREPESYVAWGVLAESAGPREARAAARRAAALNPRSAFGDGP